MSIASTRLVRIARSCTIAVATLAVASTSAVSSASAETIGASEETSTTAASQEFSSVIDSLENGSWQITAPEGSSFARNDSGEVTLVAANGDELPLSSTITGPDSSYSGDWSIQGGDTATLTVTSTQRVTGSSAGTVSPTARSGWATCVVENTAAASIIAAVVGVATGPGEVAVVPITMVAALAVYGITCAS